MKNVISFFEFERVKPHGNAARVTIVQVPTGIDGNSDIVINVSGIGVISYTVSAPLSDAAKVRTASIWIGDLPGSGAKKLFARNIRKRIHNGSRLNVRHGANLFSIE